jgi:hypothetical protein
MPVDRTVHNQRIVRRSSVSAVGGVNFLDQRPVVRRVFDSDHQHQEVVELNWSQIGLQTAACPSVVPQHFAGGMQEALSYGSDKQLAATNDGQHAGELNPTSTDIPDAFSPVPPSLNTSCLKRFIGNVPTWSRNFSRHPQGLLRVFDPLASPLLAYVPVPKAASSILRFGYFANGSEPFTTIRQKIYDGSLLVGRDINFITFVRDPVARFASAYAEVTRRETSDFLAQASARIGQSPWDPGADCNGVHLQLTQFVSDIENGWTNMSLDEHLAAQSHYLADFPAFSFMGRVENPKDWEHLNHMLHTEGSDKWNKHPDQVDHVISDALDLLRHEDGSRARMQMVLNALSPLLVGKICRLYAVDYCCLGLPVPAVCTGLCSIE